MGEHVLEGAPRSFATRDPAPLRDHAPETAPGTAATRGPAPLPSTSHPPALRDPRYDILFEPVRIGPIVAKNRFFQVPHCNGMGYRDPTAQAEMRRVKAEGGWAVVCTEEVEIHPTSDITPYIELRLWDEGDVASLARIAEAIHEGGALAGIELAHNGMNASNLTSREAPIGPAHLPVVTWAHDPVQARMMGPADIAALRRWHRLAVRRALEAGYDLVYVYAGHSLSVLQHFLSRRYNQRSDAYGGSLENRARLLAEILEDTREECEGRAAVACRLSIAEEGPGSGLSREEAADVVSLLDDLPDLWDFVLGTWEADSPSSRFSAEAAREPLLAGLKQRSAKPVVAVAWLTSPDTMVRLVRSGVVDLIGAARPSIADPFLPAKIEAGRLEDIRECIGCNICVSGDMTMAPIRCTQNPAMGEEWRRGWHPERIRPAVTDAQVLVVGAGPTGLEAARALGQRGYPVLLAEAGRELGGRVVAEARLPGLGAWRRVVDWRLGQLRRYDRVEVARESRLDVDDVLGSGFGHVLVATGARWRADGVGRWHTSGLPLADDVVVVTPDDLFAEDTPLGDARGSQPSPSVQRAHGSADAQVDERREAARRAFAAGPRRVVLFDDDHYYLGGVLAELLASAGHEVRLVTPAPVVSSWTANTLELDGIQRRVRRAGVTVETGAALVAAGGGEATLASVYTAEERRVPMDVLVLVTARLPVDGLAAGLEAARPTWEARGLRSVTVAGDAWAPSTIAAAVWAGRRYAEELDAAPTGGDGLGESGAGLAESGAGFRREYTALAPLPGR